MTEPVIIDIIAVSLLVGLTICGARRGLFRALAGLLIVVLALAGARFAANALAPPAAKWAEPAIQRYIEKRLDEALPEEGAPEELLPEELLELLGVAGVRMEDLADRARESVRETGTDILTAVARSVTEAFLYGAIEVLAFLLLAVLLNLAAKAMDLALRLPVLHGANALGGAAVGLIEGALAVWLLALLLRRLGVSPEGSYLLNLFHNR